MKTNYSGRFIFFKTEAVYTLMYIYTLMESNSSLKFFLAQQSHRLGMSL